MAESFTVPLVSPVVRPESRERLMQELASADLGRQIAHLLLTSSEAGSLLHQIASRVGEGCEVDCCVVAVQDRQKRIKQTTYWYREEAIAGFSPEDMNQLQERDWVEILAGSDLFVISDTRAAVNDSGEMEQWKTLPVRAVLGITTRFEGEINGAIVVMQGCFLKGLEQQGVSQSVGGETPTKQSQPYCWTAIEMMKLTAVSEQVAIALNHVIQSQALGALQQQVRSSVKYQDAIHELTMAIHRSTDLNRILQMAIDRLAETFQVDRGLILLLKYAEPLFKSRFQGTSNRNREGRETGSDLQKSAQSPQPIPKARVTVAAETSISTGPNVAIANLNEPQQRNPTVVEKKSFWLSECGWCQQAFAVAPKPLAIADLDPLLSLNPDFESGPLFGSEKMPALLTLALVGANGGGAGNGTVLGFIVLQHSSPRTWQAEEIRLVELIAAQLSTAILQTQTLQQVGALVEERTAQLQRSLEVQAKLHEKTRQQIEQLRQLNQLKDEFLTTLSHELNTPLTTMKMAIEMLRRVPAERQGKYLDILEAEWNRESNLVNDLLKLQQFESNQASIKVEMLDLKPLLREFVEYFEQKWTDKGISISLELPKRSPKGAAKQFLKLHTDPDSFDRILRELFTNAGKYSDAGTTVHLRVTHQLDLDRNEVVLSLTNIGAGISPDDLPHIFDKFRRGQGVTEQAIGGTGLGLALVKCLVQHLNGTITAYSRPLENSEVWETCFTLTLPQLVESSPT